MDTVEFTLNGKEITIRIDASTRLLDCLRDNFNLKGVKEGCGEGECGACAVLIDGCIVNSCLVPAGNVNGRKVVTIEGFRETKRYRVLEESFAEAGAVQCGFCTPGMIMAAESLLNGNPEPDEREIREAISGNLCRCTGYNMIVEAVRTAAAKGKDLW